MCVCIWDYRLRSANSHSDIIMPEEIKTKRLTLVDCAAKEDENERTKKNDAEQEGDSKKILIITNEKIIPFTEFYLSSNAFFLNAFHFRLLAVSK